ncbi:MAG: dipeptide epimerase [Chloroflexi bacterium]|jgi:L-alanine-DL-glutamate epimerase-like enolase superfamily enzyme|nr:dipeptide epimerase [Chloroflexota bacterium]
MSSPETGIRSIEFEPLNIPLIEPFIISIGRLDHVRNVLITVTLENGVIGYGEAAPLEPINGENQATVLATLQTCVPLLVGRDAMQWRKLSGELAGIFSVQAAARAGLEMAILDAVTKTMRVPLYQFFGGYTDRVETDISIPIVEPDRARELAQGITAQGVRFIKIKVGSGIEADVARTLAVKEGAPNSELQLDANQAYSASEAVELLQELRARGVRVRLFEQPVPKHDRIGLKFVTDQGRVPVAGDEAVFVASDVMDLAHIGAANVVNIKLMKSGLVTGMDIVAVCRAAHIRLMIGGMIESKLAMSCSAHFAAGNGGFEFVDLDTPFLLAEDPFEGGYRVEGPIYHLGEIKAGIGCWPKGRPSGMLE